MAVPNIPSADVLARRQYTSAPVTIDLSTTTAKNSAALTAGCLYLVWADVVWHFRHGGHASVTATTDDAKLGAYQQFELWVSGADSDGIAGILGADTGTCYLQRVD